MLLETKVLKGQLDQQVKLEVKVNQVLQVCLVSQVQLAQLVQPDPSGLLATKEVQGKLETEVNQGQTDSLGLQDHLEAKDRLELLDFLVKQDRQVQSDQLAIKASLVHLETLAVKGLPVP